MDVAGILRAKGAQVWTVPPETTVADAVALLHTHEIGALIVGDGTTAPAGIISERDVVTGLADRGADFLNCTLDECMSSPVLTCAPSDSDREIMALMTDRRVRHLPVVEDGKLCGIVSIGDVVKSRIDGIMAEADALKDYIVRG